MTRTTNENTSQKNDNEYNRRALRQMVGAGLAAVALFASLDGGSHIIGHFKDVYQQHQIIDDPANIPVDHRVNLEVGEGDTAGSIAGRLAQDGDYGKLQDEIQHQVDENGNLQPGQKVAAYSSWVDPIAYEKYLQSQE